MIYNSYHPYKSFSMKHCVADVNIQSGNSHGERIVLARTSSRVADASLLSLAYSLRAEPRAVSPLRACAGRGYHSLAPDILVLTPTGTHLAAGEPQTRCGSYSDFVF